MIAVIRAMVNEETFLSALAVAIITFSLVPPDVPRQHFSWRDSSGQVHHYSLSTDDARLKTLRRELRVWRGEWPTCKLAVAKWRQELADFYAQELDAAPTDEADGEVVQVSFHSQTEAASDDSLSNLSPSTAQYWRRVSSETAREVANEERKLERRKSGSVKSPIVFGKVVDQGRGLRAFLIAFGGGVAAWIVFSLWSLFAPLRRLVAADETEQPESIDGREFHNVVRIEIPAAWVRLHQPTSVVIRRVCCGFFAAWALCTLLV